MNMPKPKSALTPKSELPWSFWDAAIRFIFYYGLILIFMMVFQLGLPNLVSLANITINTYVVEATVVGVVGFLLTYIFLTFDQKKLSSLGFKLHKRFLVLIIIALVVTTIALSFAYYIEHLGGVVDFNKMWDGRYHIEDLSRPNQLIDYLVIVFITFFGIAIGEEIMFRGYLQHIFESQTNVIMATLFSSILFGLLHSFLLLASSVQVIQSMVAVGISATIFGFVFTYASKISGKNLTLPILIHGIWNNIIFFFNTQFNYENIGNIMAEITSQIVAACVLIGLLFIINRYTDLIRSD